MTIRYPCTGHVGARGFAAFLDRELGAPRANLQAFAAELALHLDAEHVTLVGSGSSANLAAACALRERARGARAVVSAFTFPTTVSALGTAGFEPIVVDVEPGGFQMDPLALARALDDDVAIVAPTHFLGWPARIREIGALARRHDALVMQDACETFEMRIDGEPIHRLADATTYSFYHPHHLSSFGGGAVIVRDAEVRAVVESVVHWGRACTHHLGPAGEPCPAPDGPDHQFHYVRAGYNLEMSELNACFGRWTLRARAEDEAKRLRNWAALDDVLARVGALVTYRPADVGCSPFVYPITVRGDDARPLVDRLLARGVEVRSWMGGPIVDQPAWAHLAHDGLPNARAIARRSFFVGIHQTLACDDVAEVARIVAAEAART